MQDALNDLQREAIAHREGPALIFAGPGTGKTRILEERTIALIDEGIYPAGISILTFTRKAADENRRRIAARLPIEIADQVQASTLHSLALRVLIAVSRKRRCEIHDVVDPRVCYSYLRRSIIELGLDTNLYAPLSLWKTMQQWKATGRDFKLLDPPVRRVFERYRQILVAENKWDLADLVTNALDALRAESDIAAAFQSLRYLMVDEFQDMAPPEYRFLKAILGQNRNLFCVGAVAQSIYSWRGADARVLLECFDRDYPEAKKIVLRQNYRSGSNIIAVAASMVPEEREVYLASKNGSGQVFLKECLNNLAEAHLIAGLLRDLRDRDILQWNDFAILVRSWAQVGHIEQALIDHQVPYMLFGDHDRYYEHMEIRALYAYLRAVFALQGGGNFSMDGALDRIINTPPRGIGPRSVQMIRGSHPEITWDRLMAAAVRKDLREQVRQAVTGLFELLTRLAKLADELTPSELISRVIRETGWEQSLVDELEGKTMLRNLRAFQEEANQYGTLESFIVAMSSKIRSDLADKGVALSTIHAAKGLEWPCVFVAGLNQGLLPTAQSLRSAENGDPIEERHVAHVAFSRARQLLFLTWARERLEADGRTQALRPSMFLGRLPMEMIHEFDTLGSIGKLHTSGGPADLQSGEESNAEEVL